MAATGGQRPYRHPFSKLTDEQVREARSGKASYKVLAQRWGVDFCTVYRAGEGINYKWVRDDDQSLRHI